MMRLLAFMIFFVQTFAWAQTTLASEIKVKKEYRCIVRWQKNPSVISKRTGGEYENNRFTFVEFDQPLTLNENKIYGIGGNGGAINSSISPGENLDLWTELAILKKEEIGKAIKFHFGMLQQQLSPKLNLQKAVQNSFGVPMVGFLILNQNSPQDSAFQRAPIPADTSSPGWLKPTEAGCKVIEKKYSVDPFKKNLGKFFQ